MYAIIQLGSKQYKVSEGDSIVANRLPNEIDKTVSVDQVLLYSDGQNTRVGQPFLKDVKVTAKVMRHFLGDKVIAFKFRRRKDSCTKRAHRQKLTALNITKITLK